MLQLVLKDILGRTVEPVFVEVDELVNLGEDKAPPPVYEIEPVVESVAEPTRTPTKSDAPTKSEVELYQSEYVQKLLSGLDGTIV